MTLHAVNVPRRIALIAAIDLIYLQIYHVFEKLHNPNVATQCHVIYKIKSSTHIQQRSPAHTPEHIYPRVHIHMVNIRECNYFMDSDIIR